MEKQEQDNKIYEKFMVPILLLVMAVLSAVYFVGMKAVPNFSSYSNAVNDVKMKTTSLEDKQRQLDSLSSGAAVAAKKATNSEKPFYKPIMEGLNSEAVIAGEFAEILQLAQANKVKIRSIKYEYDKDVADDSFAQNAGDKYYVARLNMEMIANYTSFDTFLKELYKHDHFLDIQQVEIVPYRKNRKVLLINSKIKLYSKK